MGPSPPNSAGFITRESRTSEQRKQNPYDIPLYGLVYTEPDWPIVTEVSRFRLPACWVKLLVIFPGTEPL